MQERDLIGRGRDRRTSGPNRWGYDAYRPANVHNPNIDNDVARPPPRSGVIGFFAGWIVEDELHVTTWPRHRNYRRLA